VTGYVDPAIVASSPRERRLLEAIKARGLMLHRLHSAGSAVRLTGPGLHITASTLASIALQDLDADPVARDTRRRP
jgi:hypothetical protein